MALFGKQGRDLGPAPNLSVDELRRIMAEGQAYSDSLAAQGEPSQINFWAGMQPQYQAILDYMNQNGLTNTSQVPEAYKRFLVPQEQDKTFGDQLASYITNPAVLTAIGGVAGVYAGGAASAAGAGSGSTGATVGGLTAAEEAAMLGAATPAASGGGAAVAGTGLGASTVAPAASGGTALGGVTTGGSAAGTVAAPAGGAAAGASGGGLLSGSNLATLAGGVLGAMDGSKQAGQTTSTGTQVTDVPDWQKPYIQGILGQASQAQSQIGTGTPLLGPAQNEYLKTITGGYSSPDSNPYLRATFDQAARGVTDAYSNVVQPRTDSMFFGPGSMGGNTAYGNQVQQNQVGLGRGLSELATNIYGGNYQQERGRQFGATTAAPQFTQAGYQAAYSPYASYLDVIGRPFGTSGATSQSNPYYTNPAAGAVGGALLGSQLYRQFQQPQQNQYGSPNDMSYGWLGMNG